MNVNTEEIKHDPVIEAAFSVLASCYTRLVEMNDRSLGLPLLDR
jgi:hypothetical protein